MSEMSNMYHLSVLILMSAIFVGNIHHCFQGMSLPSQLQQLRGHLFGLPLISSTRMARGDFLIKSIKNLFFLHEFLMFYGQASGQLV